MQPEALVDIGINLAHDSYDGDREAVVQRAVEAGVTRMVVTGSCIGSAAGAIAICRQWPQLMRATAGIHPHHAAGCRQQDLVRLEQLLTDPMVTSAGECGLDYFRDFSPRPDQRRIFSLQLELAARLGMPVFLHQRDAHEDFLAILDEYLPRLPRAVVHCFTGTGTELARYLDRGLYVGITGWICDERRGLEARNLVPSVPLDRLMLETDGPYLLPRSVEPKPRHRRNEPSNLRYVFKAVCEVRAEDPQEVAATTTANAVLFFELPGS